MFARRLYRQFTEPWHAVTGCLVVSAHAGDRGPARDRVPNAKHSQSGGTIPAMSHADVHLGGAH